MIDQPMPTSGQIRVRANGEDYDTAFGTTLANFVKARGLAIERVVVERNGDALSPSEARHIVLQDRDRLEIVRIVAGG